jgi:hypothetical protein
MQRRTHYLTASLFCLIAICLTMPTPAQEEPAATQPAATSVDESLHAERLIMIRCDPSVYPLAGDDESLHRLISSLSIAGAAAEKTLGVPAAIGRDACSSNVLTVETGAKGTVIAVIRAATDQKNWRNTGVTPKPAAGAFLDEVIKLLRERLKGLARTNEVAVNNQFRPFLTERERSDVNIQQLKLQLREKRQEYGRPDLTVEGVLREAQGLEQQKQQLKMKLVGYQARAQAVENAIAKRREQEESNSKLSQQLNRARLRLRYATLDTDIQKAKKKMGRKPCSY